jgi:vacuolar protein sorting-associated protein 35
MSRALTSPHTQVFPDEFHLQTLTAFLDGCGQLQHAVNLKNIIAALIDRLVPLPLIPIGPNSPFLPSFLPSYRLLLPCATLAVFRQTCNCSKCSQRKSTKLSRYVRRSILRTACLLNFIQVLTHYLSLTHAQGRDTMAVEDIVSLQGSLINLALKCYPSRPYYVNTVPPSQPIKSLHAPPHPISPPPGSGQPP